MRYSLFKCFGGKFYLADFIISNFPEHKIYVEPFCGGGTVLLRKNPSEIEIINDIDSGIISIFESVKNDCNNFLEKLSQIEYCKENFTKALNNEFDKPINEFILRRMSRSGMKKNFSWSERLRGGQVGDVNAWQNAIKNIPLTSKRLQNVKIYNKPAIEIIKIYNNENVLLYCDPPYLHETRVSKNVYDYEMNRQEHIELAEELNDFKGKVVLSGYESNLYNQLYKNWNKIEKSIVNHSSQQKKKSLKKEVLWIKY